MFVIKSSIFSSCFSCIGPAFVHSVIQLTFNEINHSFWKKNCSTRQFSFICLLFALKPIRFKTWLLSKTVIISRHLTNCLFTWNAINLKSCLFYWNGAKLTECNKSKKLPNYFWFTYRKQARSAGSTKIQRVAKNSKFAFICAFICFFFRLLLFLVSWSSKTSILRLISLHRPVCFVIQRTLANLLDNKGVEAFHIPLSRYFELSQPQFYCLDPNPK